MTVGTLEGGFIDPPREAARAFRALMTAIARPGTVSPLSGAMPPRPISSAAGTLLLTLADTDTPIFLAGGVDTPEVRSWIAFHTGAPMTGPSHAMFAIGRWDDLVPLDQYPIGTPEYPDRSTTLIVEMDSLEPRGSVLTGPGIRDRAEFALPDDEAMSRNSRLFPLGLDFYFTCGESVAALPRSTRIG